MSTSSSNHCYPRSTNKIRPSIAHPRANLAPSPGLAATTRNAIDLPRNASLHDWHSSRASQLPPLMEKTTLILTPILLACSASLPAQDLLDPLVLTATRSYDTLAGVPHTVSIVGS